MHRINYSVIAVCLGTLLLSGCGTKNNPVDFKATPIEKQKLSLPTPEQVRQDPVKWYALAKKSAPGDRGSMEYFWKEMEKKGYTTGIAISPGDFEKLAKNNDALRKYILQQKAIIKAYERYYAENQ